MRRRLPARCPAQGRTAWGNGAAMGEALGWAGVVEDGEQHSLEELYRRYRGPVQHYLFQLSGSSDQAEELVQETFIRACGGLLTFRGDCSVATWLFRIARNTYLNSLRHR